MPRRNIPLVTGEVYHVFNRGIDKRTTFTSIWEYNRAMKALDYYRFRNPPIRLSKYLRLEENQRSDLMVRIEKTCARNVDILAYCLMPNHFHLLLRQSSDYGIARFLSNFQNSYVRYFNTRHQRLGQLFLVQFKAVLIEDDEQLIHVSRYIHLNPYTSHILKSLDELFAYKWSSLREYLDIPGRSISSSEEILNFFREKSAYKQFITDQASYQRELDIIKHLTIE